jgi:hypothetical protein
MRQYSVRVIEPGSPGAVLFVGPEDECYDRARRLAHDYHYGVVVESPDGRYDFDGAGEFGPYEEEAGRG